ncbi:MAG: SGNH/GDSL hydrolase family protein, partial [Clostridia bacterium]|nr:SGNH/GDSL hydrolase family protein [Clostridia bacterium]
MKKFLALLLAGLLLLTGCASQAEGTDSTDASDEPKDSEAPDTDAGTDDTGNEAQTRPEGMREGQVYAADLFDTSDSLCIAFLGGSLTAGGVSVSEDLPDWPRSGNKWTNDVVSYFVQKYRGVKTVTAYNAALGGTTSDYAAARFDGQIACHEPDIVFIEYSCNDSSWPEEKAPVYVEYLVRKCLELDKIPSIIVVHAPIPQERNDEGRYIKGIAAKEKVVENYGIKSVNVYEYLEKLYAESGFDGSFFKWLGPEGTGFYKQENETTHNVHPFGTGYAQYSDAILAEFDSDFGGCINRPKFADILCTSYTDLLNSTIKMVKPDDDSISYDGKWTLYTDGEQVYADSLKEGNIEHSYSGMGGSFEYPYFPDGIMLTNAEGASFTVTVPADVVSIAMGVISSEFGGDVTVTLDGSDEEIGSLSDYSPYYDM